MIGTQSPLWTRRSTVKQQRHFLIAISGQTVLSLILE